MTVYRIPDGIYHTKEGYLEAYKETNNIEFIEEDVFLDCLHMEIGCPHNRFYWRNDRVQPRMRKRSKIRYMKIFLMTWFVRITD